MRSLLLSVVATAMLAGAVHAQTPPAAPAPAAPPAATSKTEILWDEEAALVMGDHPLVWRRLDKIKGNKRGALKIVDDGGVWKISGRHQGQTADTKEDYVTIKGVITAVTSGTFVVNGEIEFFAAKMNKGAACRLTGESRFYRRGSEQIWRLQNGENPCSGPKEALDVTFRPDQVAARPKPARASPTPVPPKVAPTAPTVQQ